MKCPKCAENGIDNELEWDNLVLTSMPPQYRHICSFCGWSECYYDVHYKTNKPLNFVKDNKFYDEMGQYDSKSYGHESQITTKDIIDYTTLQRRIEFLEAEISIINNSINKLSLEIDKPKRIIKLIKEAWSE